MNGLRRALPLITLLLACGGEEEPAQPEACRHMAGGSVLPVSNGGTVASDNRRYDLTLDSTKNPSARVLFHTTAPQNWWIYLSENVPLRATKDGQDAGIVGTVTGTTAGACSATGVRLEFNLGVGNYELVFGATHLSSVSLVIEPRT